MTTVREQLELQKKLQIGLQKTYEKLIEFKKQKGTNLVVVRDGKIVRIKP
jgi:sulfur carrier protein ThiS